MPSTAATPTTLFEHPAPLIAYGVVGTGVGIAVAAARRSVAGGRPVGDLTGRPHHLAHLGGGPDLAVFAALVSLRLHGLITCAAGRIQASGRIGTGAPELVGAVHGAADRPIRRTRLRSRSPVAAALTAMRTELVRAGLLLSTRQRLLMRALGIAMVAVAGGGFLWALTGLEEGTPDAGVMVLGVVFAVVAFRFLRVVPRTTRSADRALAELRQRHGALRPGMRPDWTVYGAETAVLGLALFGIAAMWASDPVFAAQLQLQRASPGGSDDGGCGSDSCGSDGGSCGGDSGGGDSGSSSCGGGCGGGGGD